jgi:hypothetical protein
MRALLLCNRPSFGSNASTISEHIDALNELPGITTFELSTVKVIPNRLDLDLFDVIIIHYTIQLGEFNDHFLNTEARQRLSKSRGLKVLFIQDEYRETLRVHRALKALGISLVFTLLSESDAQLVYPKNLFPNMQVRRVLAAYISDNLLKVQPKPITSRSILVSYRARKMPLWLGSLAIEKWQIGVSFLELARRSQRLQGHRIDISWKENKRLYGNEWYSLLSDSRCVLGVESGANVLDVDGSLKASVEKMLQTNAYSEAQVYEKLVKKKDNLLHMNQIAARHLEACTLGTVQILFEGSYSNILSPGIHYLPLKKDFSNFDEIVDICLDEKRLQTIADRARKDIALSGKWAYSEFSRLVSNDLHDLARNTNSFAMSTAQYSTYKFICDCFLSHSYLVFRVSSAILGVLLKVRVVRGTLISRWHSLDESTKKRLRPILSIIGR